MMKRLRILKLDRLVQHEVGHAIVEPAAQVAQKVVAFDLVTPIDHVVPAGTDLVIQPPHFFGRILPIVVEDRRERSANVVQSCQHGSVLAEIAGQV